jgi:ParB/RepB/Spo0J family partition protein
MARRQRLQEVPVPAPLPASLHLPAPRQGVVALGAIDFAPYNKRTFREGDARDLELLENLRATGRILEPLLVRPVDDRFCLIAGERRVYFGRLAGILEADVVIYDVDLQTAMLMTWMENRFRKDLHCLEEASAIADLQAAGLTQEMIAAQIGMSTRWIALRARLTNLSPAWRELALNPDPELAVRLWNPSLLEVIALLSKDAQDELLTSHPWLTQTEPSLSELRGIVAEKTLQLSGAPWDLDDESLCPQAGACSSCPARSSVQAILFTDLFEDKTDLKDRCLSGPCWKAKAAAFLARTEAELRSKHPDLVLLTTTGSREHSGAIPSYSARPAKKKDPGAVLALVLDGSDRGKTRWVHPPEVTPPAAAAAAAPAPPPLPGQRAKTPLAVRREALNRRRKLLAIQAIAAAVAESVQLPPLSTILALGFVFGTEQTLNFGNLTWDLALDPIGRPTTPLPLWTLAETLAETSLDDLGRHLWGRVHPVLLKRLTILGTPSPEDVARAYEEASKLAALVGVDSAQHLLDATTTLADPQSWAEEEAALARALAADQHPDRTVGPDDDSEGSESPVSDQEASDDQENLEVAAA